MTLDTNFNLSPYFDDFDEDKNFHRVLFKPAVAVQARELTQLQTILQTQIERFGDNILVEGTIIRGCNFTEINKLGYVKIRDLQEDGQPVNVALYDGARVVGQTTGIEAFVRAVGSGLESQSPTLNTLFVKYLTTGSGGQKEFATTELLEVQNFSTGEVIATVSAAGAVETNSVGFGYGVIVGDGIIYQKGHFIRVDEQITIVSRYTDTPDGLVVGFETTESIVNSNQDTSLLDNAQGFNNYNAPGADRLKLTPVLVTKTLAQAKADEKFFAIQEYANGKIVRRNKVTQYAGILSEMQRRTNEESGDYIVNDFNIRIDESTVDANSLIAYVGTGLGYIDGKRVELLDEIGITFDKADTFKTELSQNITTNYGHYVLVDQYLGFFNVNEAEEINLYDTAQLAANNGGISSASGSSIGTAKIRALSLDNGTPGDENAQYRAYIFDIRMNANTEFKSVRSIVKGTDGQADIVLDPVYDTIGNLKESIALVKEQKFKRMFFPIGRKAIKSLDTTVTDYSYNTISDVTISTGGTFSITIVDANEEWEYGDGALNATQKRELLLVAQATNAAGGYTDNVPVDLSSATVTINTSTKTMTVTNLSIPDATVAAKLYHTIKKDVAVQADKDVITMYVKIDANNNTSGEYCLGVPDAFELVSVWKGTTYSEGSPSTDVTSQFTLYPNQRDGYYDLSKVVASRSLSITDADKILIKFKAFKKNTSQGDGYFSINSYPVDDSLSPANNTISTEQIPSYKAENGITYYLRDVIDFRPYAANTAAYAESAGAATEDPSDTVSFGASELYIPKPNGVFETNYDYYLGRVDYLYIDADQNFTTITGFPSETPNGPGEPSTGLILAEINVPPFPSITKRVADRLGKPDYGVTYYKRSNRGYTMRDIAGIEKRINNLEYYTALNTLEQSAINMLISDENNLDRFKNGIFVDSFQDLSLADVTNLEFSAGIDPSYKELTPKFDTVPIKLKAFNKSSWSGVQDFSNTAVTLSKSDKLFIEQPYATSFRNCVTDFYNFNGVMNIDPVFDTAYDTVNAPDVNVNIDITSAFVDFTENLARFVPLSQTALTNTTFLGTSNVRTTTSTRGDWRTTTTLQDMNFVDTFRTSTLVVDPGNINTQRVGDFVTDLRFNPFLRSVEIRILAFGLRPNLRHYFFFDDINVDTHVAPAAGSLTEVSGVRRSGNYGAAVTSDANGILRAVFRIPEETFYVGDRKITVIDVNNLTSISAATSKAEATYRGFSFDINKQGLSISTRMPDTRTNSTTFNGSVRSTTQVISRTTEFIGERDGGGDPISQTFTISSNHSDDNVVMVTKIDVFFEKKSTQGNGVTIELRETDNGYPSGRIIPFSRKHLTVDQVNISANASIATSITFDAPVTLKTGEQYAVVVLPDRNDPDYRIWISRTGEVDTITGLGVTSDFSDGTLFTSTNNAAWTAYQNENLKFNLYKAVYSSTSGSIQLTNKNNEFLSLDNVVGNFILSERVGVLNANSAGTVAVTAACTTVTGTSTTFTSTFEIGDFIAVYTANDTLDFLEVSSVSNNTVLTVADLPKASNTTSNYFKTMSGDVSYYDRDTPPKLILENSTAKPALRFEANNTIIGESSGATAEIVEVLDQNISYVQPNIQRTNFARTTSGITASRLTTSSNTTYTAVLQFNDNIYLRDYPTVIKSRSNEISGGVTNGNEKSFVITLNLENRSLQSEKSSSPFIDYGISGFNVTEYLINNPALNYEETIDGDAQTKYISKVIELASDLDADDIKVFLSGYRPVGTDIEVYVRFQNTADSRLFDTVEWTKLTLKSESTLFSSTSNRFDFRELEYIMPAVESTADLTAGGGAALDESDFNTLKYIASDGSGPYSRYRTFALKIVLLADSHKNVPRLKDVRAIALS